MKRARGFTLVEILIVVIILGILAAIVIPQFTNASQDARHSSVASTLQTLRSQLELFKVQHNDKPPTTAAIANWELLLATSSTTETSVTNPSGTFFGPYLQSLPVNPINGHAGVASAPSTTVGWVYTVTGSDYAILPVDTAGNTFLP
jgi:general secretion pathway protein G